MRGFQYQLKETIILPPSLDDWWTADARSAAIRSELNGEIDDNPLLYRFDGAAVNIYINAFDTSGTCAKPENGGTMIILGRAVYRELLAHEVGHFFGLCHTQGCQCAGTDEDAEDPPICKTQPGDDGLADTLPDLDSWDQDMLSVIHFGQNYTLSSLAQRADVDAVYTNLMSYHIDDALINLANPAAPIPNPYNFLTQMQLDRYTDNMHAPNREGAISGTTWFLSPTGNDSGAGQFSSQPFSSLNRAHLAVWRDDDIIQATGGTYVGNVIISKKCTIRSNRGPAIFAGN